VTSRNFNVTILSSRNQHIILSFDTISTTIQRAIELFCSNLSCNGIEELNSFVLRAYENQLYNDYIQFLKSKSLDIPSWIINADNITSIETLKQLDILTLFEDELTGKTSNVTAIQYILDIHPISDQIPLDILINRAKELFNLGHYDEAILINLFIYSTLSKLNSIDLFKEIFEEFILTVINLAEAFHANGDLKNYSLFASILLFHLQNMAPLISSTQAHINLSILHRIRFILNSYTPLIPLDYDESSRIRLQIIEDMKILIEEFKETNSTISIEVLVIFFLLNLISNLLVFLQHHFISPIRD
jgi:hypothetical protein